MNEAQNHSLNSSEKAPEFDTPRGGYRPALQDAPKANWPAPDVVFDNYEQVDDRNERAIAEIDRLNEKWGSTVDSIMPTVHYDPRKSFSAGMARAWPATPPDLPPGVPPRGEDIIDELGRVAAKDDVPFKYNEFELVTEVYDYLASTYGKHYVGDDNVQAMDLIASTHHAEGFCIGSIIKYVSRYGKKGGRNRADLLKIIHYALFALWDKDKRNLK
jgi:hypothetical protein